MNPYGPATNSRSTVDRLDQIRISADARRMARASVRQAEFVANMFIGANDALRHILALIGRGIGAVAHRSNARAATPEWRLP